MEKTLIIIDDDIPFRNRLAYSMEKKGFVVESCSSATEAKKCLKEKFFSHAIVDMRLDEGSGLEIIQYILKISPKTQSLLLTGYGNIATAVAAIKAGAIDYLAKPVDAEDVETALLADPSQKAHPPEDPMSADRVKWEHIHRIFELCNRNVSETARRLKMHRRTLQRILSKRSPK